MASCTTIRKRKMKYGRLAVVAFTSVGLVQGLPKYETPDKGFVASKGDYVDQVAMETAVGANITENVEATQDRPPRFGFPTYSQDVQTVNNALPGIYGPVKLDIGGLVLGTIVGLGAFYILPKLFHVVSTPYGGYKRSEDGTTSSGYGMDDILNKIQDSLNAYNIDSSACLQRAICFSVQSASEKSNNNTANSLESVVDNVAKNDIIKSLINGTDWKKAIDVSKKEDCNTAFSKCPVEVDTIVSAIAKYFMS